ncbi:MAG: HlyC/CorC family transporter [Armatimonadota bacterium]|nr:MAG: HlyC/CorC family transporter [Armatimonadota bacterium]
MDDPSSALHSTELASYAGQLVAIAVCFFLLAFSSLSEAALMRVDLGRARQVAAEGRRGAARLVRLVENRQEVLSTLILLINLSIIVSSAYATEVTIGLSEGAHRWVPVTSVGMIAFLLIFCEVAPKTYGVRRAESVALAAAPLLSVLHMVVNPIGQVLHAIAVWFNRRLLVPVIGGKALAGWPSYSDEEVMQLVAKGAANGDIEAEEQEMIAGVIEFAEKVVREVMTPRTDMVCVPDDQSLVEVARLSDETGYSRLPVYQESVDNVIGILYAKDMVSAFQSGREQLTAGQVARKPAPVVPESKPADEVLHLMQRNRLHLAIAFDEYGGTAGLVTIEDLLEEIFGEIQDEYDTEREPIRVVDETTVILDARVSVNELESHLGVTLPEGEFDSIGGFILHQLGRLPAVGEKAVYSAPSDAGRDSDDGGERDATKPARGFTLEFTVEKVSENRIQQVRVVRNPEEGPDEKQPAEGE